MKKKLLIYIGSFIFIIFFLYFSIFFNKDNKNEEFYVANIGLTCAEGESFQYVKGVTENTNIDINPAELPKLNWVEIPFIDHFYYDFTGISDEELFTTKCNPEWYVDK